MLTLILGNIFSASNNTGLLIGIVVEVLVILIAIVVIVLALKGKFRKKKPQTVEEESETTDDLLYDENGEPIEGEPSESDGDETEPVADEEAAGEEQPEEEGEPTEETEETSEPAEGEEQPEDEEKPRAKKSKKKKVEDDEEEVAENADDDKNGGRTVVLKDDRSKEQQPIIINVYSSGDGKPAQQVINPTPEITNQIVEVNGDGVVFSNKTVSELYEELSREQKSFFDELKDYALSKPDAKLSISKTNYAVKYGKFTFLKLSIKRDVTQAQFMLENEQLRSYRLSSGNKKGKSNIKVKPTVLAVTDLVTVKTGLEMIDLAYKEVTEDE